MAEEVERGWSPGKGRRKRGTWVKLAKGQKATCSVVRTPERTPNAEERSQRHKVPAHEWRFGETSTDAGFTCYNMDEPQKQNAKCKKPATGATYRLTPFK